MIVQKYIVLLDDSDGRQVWLGYDVGGRIANASYADAFRYDTEKQAREELRRVRERFRRWPGARILGTTVDSSQEIE